MDVIVSFGEWVQARRNLLRYNRSQFADLVGCAPVTIKKIERDERRPSLEMAQLLATHLQIPVDEEQDFLRRARGEFVPRLGMPAEMSLAEAQAPITAEEAPKQNLPRPTTPFFGREGELAEIARLLAEPDCRLLTILAAGGMGKTRLSIEAAAAQNERFTDGVTYVPLAPVSAATVTDPVNPLAAALIDALGIAFQGKETPEQQLFRYLRNKEKLFLFDNFEHLLAAAPFLADLLSHAPDVKILITSRERLNLQEEWLFVLHGLSYLADASSDPLAAGTGAVGLFAQRASQVKPSFALEDEFPAVLRICQLVEGMPLALELAAAWVFQLSCQEIADEIDVEIGFLSTEMRNVPQRHRSIQSIFDYSWRKLSAQERDALQKLSEFYGGFERAAAKTVAGASIQILASLAGKSLLTQGADNRYTIHELLRHFAAEKLAASVELEQEVRAKHAQFFLSFLREQEPRLKGPEALAAMTAMTQDFDNIRVAIRWAVGHQPNMFDVKIAWSLFLFLIVKGWLLEAETTIGLIIEQLMPDYVQRLSKGNLESTQACLTMVAFQRGLAVAQGFLGRLQEAEDVAERIPNLIPQTEDPAFHLARGWSIEILGWISFWQGHYISAQENLRTALELFEKAGISWASPDVNLSLFNNYILSGDFDEAERCLARAKQGFSQLKEQLNSRRLWNEMGKLATIRGQLAEAEDYFRESLIRLEELNYQSVIVFVWRERGDAARLRGEFELAQAYCRRSLTFAQEFNLTYAANQCLWSLGNLAVDEGKYEYAIRYFEAYRETSFLPQEHIGGPGWALLGLGKNEEAKRSFAASLQVMLSNQSRPIGLDALAGMALLKAREGQVEEAMELLRLVITHPSSYYESKEKAGKLLEEIKDELPAALSNKAETRGREMDLWQTAESLVAEAQATNYGPGWKKNKI